MKKLLFIIISISFFAIFSTSQVRYSFMQANNINAIFSNQGFFNYDKLTFPGGDAGFVWPAAALQRYTAVFATGIYIAAWSNGSVRAAGSLYTTHFTGGIIPVIGQVPPGSVCSDTNYKVYLVSLNDQNLVNGGVRTYNAGGRAYTLSFTSWAVWPVNQGAPYYEVNNIPGYQPGWNSDRPGIGNGSSVRPDQLVYTVYMDYTNCTNNLHDTELGIPGGSLPLGVEIQQISFSFNCSPLENTYFTKYRLINKSSNIWDSTYLGLINDADLGSAFNDAGGCDSARNLSFVYNSSNYDQMYGDNPPAVGSRIIQSPVKFTGNPLDSAKMPYGTLIGYRFINQTGSFIFKCGYACFCQANTFTEAINLLSGRDNCGNIIINRVTGQPTKFMYSGNSCARTGWFDSTSQDVSYLQSTGPFKMSPGDTQVIVFSLSIARNGGTYSQNICDLQSISDSCKTHYYNNFTACTPIGINPISSEVPDRFMLYQNYPNPFNPTTKIRFSIPHAGNGRDRFVQVIIYDVLGREISTLVDEELSSGIYEVDWDGTNYSSGVYYYKLVSNNNNFIKKMVLIK
jgi:hypothetical protein